MGLTAQENENLKQGSVPHMMSEKQLILFMDTHVAHPFIFKVKRGGEPTTCCNWYALEKFAAGGRNTLLAPTQLHIFQRYYICMI